MISIKRFPKTISLLRAGLFSGLVGMLVTCSPNPEPQPAEAVTRFYEKLFQIVEQNSINRREIDWPAYKATVLAKLGAAQTIPETEPAMTLALALLKDNHSYMVVDGKPKLFGGVGCQRSPPQGLPVNLPDIGYIEVTDFLGTELQGKQFAQAIQNNIARFDAPSLKGWIVDLRRNPGGNLYPMIAGLGPLIGEGLCGNFYDIDNKLIATYSYRDGMAFLGQTPVTKVDQPHATIAGNPKVAVLINGVTASSGEGTAIAFSGLPNTRLFGASTCGVSTGGQQYELPFYGYKLTLFQYNMANRTGKVYGKAIAPDEIVSDDQAISKAAEWINR